MSLSEQRKLEAAKKAKLAPKSTTTENVAVSSEAKDDAIATATDEEKKKNATDNGEVKEAVKTNGETKNGDDAEAKAETETKDGEGEGEDGEIKVTKEEKVKENEEKEKEKEKEEEVEVIPIDVLLPPPNQLNFEEYKKLTTLIDSFLRNGQEQKFIHETCSRLAQSLERSRALRLALDDSQAAREEGISITSDLRRFVQSKSYDNMLGRLGWL